MTKPAPPSRLHVLWREPLLHFLLLGCVLFLLDAVWTNYRGSERSIVVTEARIAALRQNFTRTWQRAPTQSELDDLIEEYVRDEVLTREALRLGLDRDDAVIRRRLRQKLEIINEESFSTSAPSDAELNAFRQAHATAFRGESRFAFEQLFFDPAKRGERLEEDLTHARTLLNAATGPTSRLGDSLFVLQPRYALTGERALAASFGSEFVDALKHLDPAAPERWQGPVASGYGQHLVRLIKVEPGADLPLAQVRGDVEREWRNAQRVAAREAHYQALRAPYRIRIADQGTTP